MEEFGVLRDLWLWQDAIHSRIDLFAILAIRSSSRFSAGATTGSSSRPAASEFWPSVIGWGNLTRAAWEP